MKKLQISVILLISIPFILQAQINKDILYLKNGSIIYGEMLEASDSLFKIQTSDGSVYIYSPAEVKKFLNEEFSYSGRKQGGPGFVLEAGFLVGSQSSEYKSPFSFNFIGNVTVRTSNIFGIGSGVEYLGQPFTPVFFEYKYLISDKNTCPFLFLRAGKLFHIKGDAKSDGTFYPYSTETTYYGGGSFTIGTGISWEKDGYETYLSFAYRNVHTSYTQKNYNSLTSTYKNAYNRLEIKFGFRF